MIELAADELILQRIKEVAAAYFSVNDLQAVFRSTLSHAIQPTQPTLDGSVSNVAKKDLIPTNSYEEICASAKR